MIFIKGMVTKIDQKKTKNGNMYQAITILSPSMDRIYTITDYDLFVDGSMLKKSVHLPVTASARNNFLNLKAIDVASIEQAK
jgi:hypothetical protein